MFLTQKEMLELTGYKYAKNQMAWLTDNRIRYLIGGDGKPRVLSSCIENILNNDNKVSQKRYEVNIAGLEKMMGIN